MRQNTRAQGFTLIELLIVVAIIGILAAVLIPNLLAARARAMDASVQAYLKEVGTYQEIYNIDNRTYAATWDALEGVGLKTAVPTGIARGAESGSEQTYCMDATASAGQVKTYRITPNGVEAGPCPS